MATTYYFLESPHEPSEVLRWLRDQISSPEEFPMEHGILIFSGEWGALDLTDGDVNVERSPLISVFESQVRRQALWTVGEVHFLAKKVRGNFPALEKFRRKFQSWLEGHPDMLNQQSGDQTFSYYLEGSVLNFADRVFALPSGYEAIQSGRYFVSCRDNDFIIERVCRSLRLRGVDCT